MTTRLLTALSRLSAGLTQLTPEQTAWMRREIAASALPAHASSPAGQTYSLDLVGDHDEQANALITIPARGCGAVLLTRARRHVDASDSQELETVQAPPANTTNGGRAAAQALLARLPNVRAAA
jgi:hypothetical protein